VKVEVIKPFGSNKPTIFYASRDEYPVVQTTFGTPLENGIDSELRVKCLSIKCFYSIARCCGWNM